MVYNIGDFSSKVNIPIKTLRYYDEIEIFKPSYIDVFSNYRYYEDEQITKINLISNLKTLGLTLEEIKEYLKTENNEILINKMKGYEDKIKMINEFIHHSEIKNYTIEIADYKKYIELNGTKKANTPQALEIRDENAKYYVVQKNNEYYTDFCIYLKNNWLTLDRKYWFDDDFLNNIIMYIKEEYDNFIYYIPIEDEKLYSVIKDKFKITGESELKQKEYIYRCVKITLKSN